MVKLTTELVVDPRMVPRGASFVLVGAMSVQRERDKISFESVAQEEEKRTHRHP